jgi:hypothetical protein
MPLHVRLASGAFPKVQLVQFQDVREILKGACLGTAAAAFLEDRGALSALRDKPNECGSQPLRVEPLPGLMLQLGVASTFQAAVRPPEWPLASSFLAINEAHRAGGAEVVRQGPRLALTIASRADNSAARRRRAPSIQIIRAAHGWWLQSRELA